MFRIIAEALYGKSIGASRTLRISENFLPIQYFFRSF